MNAIKRINETFAKVENTPQKWVCAEADILGMFMAIIKENSPWKVAFEKVENEIYLIKQYVKQHHYEMFMRHAAWRWRVQINFLRFLQKFFYYKKYATKKYFYSVEFIVYSVGVLFVYF